MLALLVTCIFSISKFVVSYGYSELTITEQSQLVLSTDLYRDSKYYAFFINNEDFQDLNMTYGANYSLFSPTIIPKNGQTVLKFVITKLNADSIDSLSIIYNGGNSTYNSIQRTKPNQFVLFLSSTEFNYRFEVEGYSKVGDFQSSPYDEMVSCRQKYENGYKKYLLMNISGSTNIFFSAEKVDPSVETTGYYKMDSCALSYDDKHQFWYSNTIQIYSPGRYEFLIGEEEISFFIDPFNCWIFPYQSNGIRIKLWDSWYDFDSIQEASRTGGFKSNSGKNLVRFEIFDYGSGQTKLIDAIINPKENNYYRFYKYYSSNHDYCYALITSWYPMNFSIFWNYSNYNYVPRIYDFTQYTGKKSEFVGVTKLYIYMDSMSYDDFNFVIYNFTRNSNDNYSDFRSTLLHKNYDKKQYNKYYVNEVEPCEFIPYVIVDKREHTEIEFDADKYKIIIFGFFVSNSQFVVIPNAEEFIFENGSKPERIYMHPSYDFILKLKPESGSKSLKIDLYYLTEYEYDTIMWISNDYDIKMKFPISEKKSFILFESAVESTITYFDEDGDGFNFTEKTGTLFIFQGEHTGIYSWKNLTELPANTIKKNVTIPNKPSIYDIGIEILMEGDFKAVRYENATLKYYAMITRDYRYYIFAYTDHFHLTTAMEGRIFTVNNTKGPCDVVILVDGVPGGLFNPQRYGSDFNNLRSDIPGYYIASKWHNFSIIYSYYPFSTTVKHNVSEIKLRLQTNNGQDRNVTVQEGETYSIESINRMIIYHPNAYVEFSQIKFDDPNVNYKNYSYSKDAFMRGGTWFNIPFRTPQQTTIVPVRTPQQTTIPIQMPQQTTIVPPRTPETSSSK
ncbi:hypothetical protein TVAG_092560 [Trichomonas vaginalis G3]|uniref:Uncharacterized protein n=1 Tax=Trichomonas vaginalis (strain ATCC PRA-98 / G3) TaxID=412133 RepID=A2F7D2_TRIV3|nr:hypothetical protein TVAGG3_0961800 [Trichomonas vaginalis G3]EAX99200.1 hypothetical protein TVAG_092560 [Trichomonas vaginalis G3]KAI5487961.1 hypothetical protein TVAGG3_0961800 [Trichomonas vaginalis G3]|eukprot:XP_001312130.1 hypothetical protein [Trichomonas vaginalis G3]